MAIASRNFDIFGTYLQTIEEAAARSAARVPLADLLRITPEPVRYRDLWRVAYRTGYSAGEFADAFRQLRAAGALDVRSDPDDPANPRVALTTGGRPAG